MNLSSDLQYPATCCKMDLSFQLEDVNCTRQQTYENSYIHHGCKVPLNILWKYYEKYGVYTMGLICGFLVRT